MKSMLVAAALMMFGAPALALAQTPTSVDSVKLDLAHQIIEANGGAKQAETSIDGMYAAMFSRMSQDMPKDQQALTLSLQHAMQREMHGLIPPIIDITVKLYATNFSEQELRDILAFQKSPSGQAMSKKAPAIMQQSMVEIVPLVMNDMPKLMKAVTDDVCTEQHCTADQRKTVQAVVDGALKPKAGA